MRLSILAENFTRSSNIIPEYGLSMHLATADVSILIDTAQGIGLFSNARTMGVDLAGLNMLALSHGHFDHTNGIANLLTFHGPMPIWAHPAVEAPHSRFVNGRKYFIGCHLNRAAVDLRPVTGRTEISRGVWAIEVPAERRDPQLVQNPAHLVLDGPNGLVPDPFEDDLSFVVEGNKGLTVLLGCSHAGVANILEEVSRLFNTRSFANVIGGMHMADQDEPFVLRVTDVLAGRFRVDAWRPCHCTGFHAAATLACRGQNVDWGYAGTALEL